MLFPCSFAGAVFHRSPHPCKRRNECRIMQPVRMADIAPHTTRHTAATTVTQNKTKTAHDLSHHRCRHYSLHVHGHNNLFFSFSLLSSRIPVFFSSERACAQRRRGLYPYLDMVMSDPRGQPIGEPSGRARDVERALAGRRRARGLGLKPVDARRRIQCRQEAGTDSFWCVDGGELLFL